MANKITVLLDLVTDRAQQSVKGFRTSIADAEGTMGKFRAGASSAMSTVQANAGSLALAGGAALVAFGTKAVTAFQDTALAAGKFSDATGLAVEDASRLIEVAGDVGVEAGTIESAIVRMNSAAAKGDLEKFGVELQRTADGTVDVNATFLETIDVLNGIKDPTERALAAQKIFGKGYKEIAEIIFDDADRVQKKLGEVSEAKIIDQDELDKARKFRESMDNLNDALDDIKLAGGEALVPLLSGLADVTVLANEGRIALDDMLPGDSTLAQGAIPFFVDAVKDVKDAFDGGSESGGAYRAMIQSLLPEINEAGRVVGELADEEEQAAASTASLSRAADRLAWPKQETEEFFEVVDRGRDSLVGMVDATDILATALDGLNEDLDEMDQLADITEQFEKLAEGTDDVVDQQGEVRRLVQLVSDYVRELDDIPREKVSEIVATLRSGDVDLIKALMDDLTKDRFINIGVNAPKPAFSGVQAGFAAGVGGTAPTFTQPTASTVYNPTIINNYPIGSTPTTVNQDQETYLRWNGPR